MMFSIDVIVEARNRDALDATMLTFGGLTGDRPTVEGYWPVRAIGKDEHEARARADFLHDIIMKQGYGTIHRWQDIDGQEVEREPS